MGPFPNWSCCVAPVNPNSKPFELSNCTDSQLSQCCCCCCCLPKFNFPPRRRGMCRMMSGEYEITGPGRFYYNIPGASPPAPPHGSSPQVGSPVCFSNSVELKHGILRDPHQLQRVCCRDDETAEGLRRGARHRQTFL